MAEADERLVLLAQAGDAHAFDRLLRAHERELFRHIQRMVHDRETAYETLQETYILIVRNIRKLRSRAAFRAWAFGVATNASLKVLRKRARRADDVVLPPEPADRVHPLPDAMASAHEEVQRLMDAVLLLTPKLCSVILLHFVEGLTLTEVAAALELSPGTVKSRLHAGLAQLRAAGEGATP